MFTKVDFWVGLAVGVVAGAVGYKVYSENKGNFNNLLQYTPQVETGDVSVVELMKQKERLEDLIAEKQAAVNA
ncbi:MAG: hypothetical protein ACOY35_04900 [Bacillota bacterium]